MIGELKNKKEDRKGQKQIQENGQKGFIKLVFILVIIIIVASFLGFSPDMVWTKAILPLVQFLWKIAVWVAELVKPLLKIFIVVFEVLIDLANRAWH